MKKILLMLLGVLMALSTSARTFLYTYQGKTLSYYVHGDNKTVSVSKYGDLKGVLEIPSVVKDENGVTYTVTIISGDAFRGCTELTSVTIPNSVTNIQNLAFYECFSLKDVYFNAENCTYCGNYEFPAFSSGIEKVTFGENVKTIPGGSFSLCSLLTEVTIPASVTSIGAMAFNDCNRLKTVYFNAENCTTCGSLEYNSVSPAFPGGVETVIFGENVKTIPDYAFYKCTGLTTVTIPNAVTSIGNNAFYNCTGLKDVYFYALNCTTCGSQEQPAFPSGIEKVTFGKNVYTVPNDAFYGCTSLSEVNAPNLEAWLNISFGNEYSNPTFYTKKVMVNGASSRRLSIPEGTTRLNSYAFVNCEELLTVSVPSSLESVGSYPFKGCTALQRISFPDEASFLKINYDTPTSHLNDGNSAKYYFASEEYNTPESITIPESITFIPDYAFYNWSTLKSVTMHDKIVSIGNGAFENCTGLTSITIPNSVTSIGSSAFSGCSGLINVTIGDFVTSIGNSAFSGCTGLTKVTIHNAVTSIGNSAFSGCTGLTKVTIPNSVTSIGERAFYNCFGVAEVTIPESVTTIGNSAFTGCTGLKDVYFNAENCTSCGDFEFPAFPSGITTLTFGKKVKIIPPYAFYQCSGLTSISLPNYVTEVGDYAFDNCTGISSLKLPELLESIGANAFSNLRYLQSISIPQSVKKIGVNAFTGWSALSSVYVEDVNTYARINFADATANPLNYGHNLYVKNGTNPIKHLVITGEEPVSAYAFEGASCLETVRIKEGAAVGAQAFENCTNLTDVCLNSASLDNQTFGSDTKIKNVYVPLQIPPTAPNNAFSNYDKVNLYVPSGCVSDYENAENCWWNFLDIFESDFEDIDRIFAPDYEMGSSGVDNVISEYATVRSNAIYNLQGICLKRNATEEDVRALSPGLYIIAGKKVLVK